MQMIRLAKPEDKAALAHFCGDSLPGTYIMSRFSCYGNDYPFARCYLAKQQEDVQTAISVLDDSAVLLTSDQTDFEELAMALPALSINTWMTEAEAAQNLPFPIMLQKAAFCFDRILPAHSAADFAPMRSVYDLICAAIPESFDNSDQAYLAFLSDFTFRQRRNRARLKAVFRGNEVCACALTAAESDCGAVISGVACRADCRGHGYGARVVASLVHALQAENKTVHVIALNDGAAGFYQKLGARLQGQMIWMQVK